MTFSELPSSGAARNQVSRPQVVIFSFKSRLQACRMRIGWEAAPLHTSAPQLRLPQSLLPDQVTLGFAPRPRLTPPPWARPGYQHIPPVAWRDAGQA